MKHLFYAALAAATLAALPAYAESSCPSCPRVQLLRAENQIRIAAQDDEDPYESLQHRVRFVTSNGNSAWSDWADTNAYGLRTAATGRVESETIDLDGNIGRGVIYITAPSTDAGSRGPGTIEEDSSVEARWDGPSTTPDGTTAEDLVEPETRPTAEDYLDAEAWDHSVCPIAPADWADDEDDGSCNTVRGPNNGFLALVLAVAGMMLGRLRR